MASTGSISVSGLLGGTAGQIDTTSLITQLMTAAALPQTELKDQLTTVQSQLTAYQSINSKISALQTAAQALTDPTAWTATAATASTPSVVAASTGAAAPGTTSFDVTQLARTQVTTVTAAADGTVVSDPTAGITITGTDNQPHTITLTSGSASDVAAAINGANVGVKASVVHTDQGDVLQMSAAKSGAANAFTASGFSSSPKNVVTAQDATISVGDPAAGGYTVSSSSNTFSSFIPGVTFSVSAVTTGVTVTVANDEQSISDKVKALVAAANAATTEVNNDSAQGAVLQGKYDVRTLASNIGSAVSDGITGGGTLKSYGIDIDKTGQMTFDATAFAAAYNADPAGTKSAVSGSFASSLAGTATAAVAPTTGSITLDIGEATTQSTNLNQQIDDWTTKLQTIQSNLQAKYAAMETALAKLQSQQTYLTSMLTSATSNSSSSSSS